MFRSGVSDQVELRKRITQDTRDIREIVKEACPVPNQNTVERLRDAWKQHDWNIRAPWQPSRVAYYDEEDVLFFARILTMLSAMGVHAPAQLQAQGGGSTTSLNFDGPMVITPGEQTSRSYLNVPDTKEEIKRNALSSDRGGLADAASRQLPEVKTQGRPQVIELVNLAMQKDQELREVDAPDGFDDLLGDLSDDDAFDSEEKELLSINATQVSDEFNQEMERGGVRNRFQRLRQVSLQTVNLVTRVQRRLKWSKLSPEKQNQIRSYLARGKEYAKKMLKKKKKNPEDETWLHDIELEDLDEPINEFDPDDTMADPRSNRYNYVIKRIATLLLIGTGAVATGIGIHQNINSTPEDDLITKFRALPIDTNWFRQLPIGSWVKIISRTPRAQNYLLLTQVSNPNLLHYSEDVNLLWWIDKLFFGQTDKTDEALRFYNIIRQDVTYRTEHNAELQELITNFKNNPRPATFTAFDFCYVARATHPSGLPVMSAFYSARPVLPTNDMLTSVAAHSKQTIDRERLLTNRHEDFQDLIQAYQYRLEPVVHSYDSEWIREMKRWYKVSRFSGTLEEKAFDNVLKELSVNSQRYPADAKLVLSDFLKRYTTTKGGPYDNVIPFQHNLDALKFDENIYAPVTTLLNAMQNYRNDQKLDALAYEFLNKHWEQHSAQTEHKSFEEATASFNLSFKAKYALYGTIDAIERGILPFMDKVQRDFTESKEEFPKSLRTTGLVNVGQPETEEDRDVADSARKSMNKQTKRIGGGRNILSVPTASNWVDYKTIPFFRTPNYILLQLGLVTVVMATNDGNMQIVTFNSNNPSNTMNEDIEDDNEFAVEVWGKTLEQSNTGNYVFGNNTSWTSRAIDVMFGGSLALCMGMMVAAHNHIGPEMIVAGIAYGGKTLASYMAAGVVNSVVIGGETVSALYQSYKVASLTHKFYGLTATGAAIYAAANKDEIVQFLSGGSNLIALALAATVVVTVGKVYLSTTKRRRLE